MGTRNLTAVFKDGEYKVAQYGQWDGYPSGQGKNVLDFLGSWDRDHFESRLAKCRYASEAEIEQAYKVAGADGSGWVNQEVSSKFDKLMPYVTRDLGAKVLSKISDSDDIPLLRDSIEFVNDGLFCEFCYVIDLDKNVLEVFTGFAKSEQDSEGRFFGEKNGDGYYPVQPSASYPLDSLPTVAKMEDDLGGHEE